MSRALDVRKGMHGVRKWPDFGPGGRWVNDCSASGPRNTPAAQFGLETQHRESCQVECSHTSLEIGGHTFQSASARSSPSPGTKDQVSDLAFDHRAIGAVAIPPRGVGLLRPGPLK